MKKSTVALILFSVVFLVVVLVSICDLNADTDTNVETKSWESTSLDDIHAVRNTIYAWIKAWQNKNLDGFMSYYRTDFRSGKLDYHGWRRKKSLLFKKPGDIFVEISNLLIFIAEKEAKISFKQEYTDAYLSDVGEKKIILLKTNGRWKIVSEEWQPINK